MLGLVLRKAAGLHARCLGDLKVRGEDASLDDTFRWRKGDSLMKRKPHLIGLAAVILISTAGICIILHEGDPGEPCPVGPELTEQKPAEAKPEQPDFMPNDARAEREILAPAGGLSADGPEEMPLSFRKALGGFKGRVVDEDGAPVLRVPVELYGMSFLDIFKDPEILMKESTYSLKVKYAKTFTGEDGTFLLDGVFPRAFYALSIDGAGSCSHARVIDHLPNPGEIVDLGDVVLPHHAVLLGRVVDENGAPVPGARVRAASLPPTVWFTGVQDFQKGGSFYFNPSDCFGILVVDPLPIFHELYNKLPFPSTLSESDGTFRLEGIPRGVVNVLFDKPDYMTTQRGPVSTGRGGETDLGDLTIKSGTTLRGEVVDEEGNPLPNVEVRVGSVYSTERFVVLQPALITGEDGTFTQGGIANHFAMVLTRRFPGDCWTVYDPFNPASETETFIMSEAYDLKVSVRDERGVLVKGAELKIKNDQSWENPHFLNPPLVPEKRMERPEPGVIIVRDLSPGPYEILVHASGYAVSRAAVELEEGSHLETEVHLRRAYSVPVRVLLKETEEPVEWAEVYSWVDFDDFVLNPTSMSRGRTDREGRAILKNMAAGKYKITAAHPQYPVIDSEITIPTDKEHLILLEPGGAVEGVVYPGTKNLDPPYMLFMEFEERCGDPHGDAPRILATDMEGKFRVTDLSAGIWRIQVRRRLFDQNPAGFLEVVDQPYLHRHRVEVMSGETTYVEIVNGGENTGPSGTVTGRVTVNGAPVEGSRLTLGKIRWLVAELDVDGRYTLENVPIGKHLFSLYVPTGRPPISLDRKVTVETNAILYEDFNILTGSITGSLAYTDGEGSPGEDIEVYIRTEDENSPYRVYMATRTDKDGAFAFETVPMGIYKVDCRSDEFSSPLISGVKVFPGKAAGPIVLKGPRPITVTGQLILPESLREYHWIHITFIPVDGPEYNKVSGMVHLEFSDEFEEKFLVPGTYKAYITSHTEKEIEPIVVEVPPEGITGLVLTFREIQ